MATEKLSADFAAAIEKLEQCKVSQKQAGWATTWSNASEAFWDGLSSNLNAPLPTIDLFVQLLDDDDRFQLARLVIPPLRDTKIPETATAPQRVILERMKDKVASTVRKEKTTQADFDDDDYVFEKRKLREVEMHRARVFLGDSGPYNDPDYQQQIQEWLQSAPTPHQSTRQQA